MFSPRVSTKDKERIELLQGTLDLLILQTLRPGPAHGHAIAKTIEFNSADVLQVEQGSLYPALHRLDPAWMDFFRRGHIGEQSSGQVLSTDHQRPPPIDNRDQQMEKVG